MQTTTRFDRLPSTRLQNAFPLAGLTALAITLTMMFPPSTLGSRILGPEASFDQREWTDASGKLVISDQLMAFNDSEVVIETEKKELLSLPVAQLSKEDQEYLKSQEARASVDEGEGGEQIWTLRSGLRVLGRVVEYGKRDVVLKRRRGKVYVNDKQFENLPEVYQRMVPQIVNHFDETENNIR